MKLKKTFFGLALIFSVVVLAPSCDLMLDVLEASTTPSTTNTTTDDNNNNNNNDGGDNNSNSKGKK